MRRLTRWALLVGLCIGPLSASAEVYWTAGMESGDLSEWGGSQTNAPGARNQVGVSDVRAAKGMRALRLQLIDDAARDGIGRVEVHRQPGDALTTNGGELFIAWSMYIATPQAAGAPNNEMWYFETNGSYVQHFRFNWEGTNLSFLNNGGGGTLWNGAGVMTPSEWHRIGIHIVFSTGNTGTIEIWFDGEKVASRTGIRTMSNGDSSFMQMGFARAPGAIGNDRPEIFVDDVVMASTEAEMRVADFPGGSTAPMDAGMPMDAGTADAGTVVDAGPVDAGAARDAGSVADASAAQDSGSTPRDSSVAAGDASTDFSAGSNLGCAVSESTQPWAVVLLALLLSRRRRR